MITTTDFAHREDSLLLVTLITGISTPDIIVILSLIMYISIDNSGFVAPVAITVKSYFSYSHSLMYNNMAFETAAVQIDLLATLNLVNVSVYDNYAYNKVGLFSILSKSKLVAKNSVFKNNYVYHSISVMRIFGTSMVS